MRQQTYDMHYKMILNTLHKKDYSPKLVARLIELAIMNGVYRGRGMGLRAFLEAIKPILTMIKDKK